MDGWSLVSLYEQMTKVWMEFVTRSQWRIPGGKKKKGLLFFFLLEGQIPQLFPSCKSSMRTFRGGESRSCCDLRVSSLCIRRIIGWTICVYILAVVFDSVPSRYPFVLIVFVQVFLLLKLSSSFSLSIQCMKV